MTKVRTSTLISRIEKKSSGYCFKKCTSKDKNIHNDRYEGEGSYIVNGNEYYRVGREYILNLADRLDLVSCHEIPKYERNLL